MPRKSKKPPYTSPVVIDEVVEPFGSLAYESTGPYEADAYVNAPPSPHFYGQFQYASVDVGAVRLIVLYKLSKVNKKANRSATISSTDGHLRTLDFDGDIESQHVGEVREDGLLWFTLPDPQMVVVQVTASYTYCP